MCILRHVRKYGVILTPGSSEFPTSVEVVPEGAEYPVVDCLNDYPQPYTGKQLADMLELFEVVGVNARDVSMIFSNQSEAIKFRGDVWEI